MSGLHTYAVMKSISDSGVSSDTELMEICEYLTEDPEACARIIAQLEPKLS
ncbi:hypothetical protein GOV11_01240 [Candidatus Woesearchaeota archaeon]|nr:hypothetical protein [Candidatus Woesearchaeota archaeon]